MKEKHSIKFLKKRNVSHENNIDNSLLKRSKLLNIVPTQAKDDFYKYEEAFQESMNEDITTIALIGGYGSGKSSLIKTYEKVSGKKFLYVSALPLVSGNKSETADDHKLGEKGIKLENMKKPVLEQQIEKKVIEQIYNQSILFRNQKLRYSLYSVFTLVTVVALFIYYIGKSSLLNLEDFLPLTISPEISIMTIMVFWAAYSIYYSYSANSVSTILDRIKVSSIELQLSKDTFDISKITSELIRIINKTNFDGIVVEDLDRFSDKDIIFQLREFSNLYNRSSNNKKKFFFLLDYSTISEDEVRAKFFDYSISVQPYLAYSYTFSYVMRIKDLTKLLGNNEERRSLAYIDNSLVKLFTEKITDQRLIRTILNDYLFLSESYYITTLQQLERSQRKEFENLLLSLSIFKHIATVDYNNFLNKKGVIYNILIEHEIETTRINSKITELKDNIQFAKSTHYGNLNELKAIQIIKKNHGKDFFSNESKFKSSQIYGRYREDIENEPEYLAIKTKIEYQHSNDLRSMEINLKKLEHKLARYTPKHDKELTVEIETLTSNHNELLKDLMVKGYLTSSITLFISSTHGGLREEDISFIDRVNNGQKIKPDYLLMKSNYKELIDQIDQRKLKSTSVYNYDLLNITRNELAYREIFEILLENMQNSTLLGKDSNKIFQNDYLAMAEDYESHFQLIFNDSPFYNDDYINTIFRDASTDDNHRFSYYLLIAIISNANLDYQSQELKGIIEFVNSRWSLPELIKTILEDEGNNVTFSKLEKELLNLIEAKEIYLDFEVNKYSLNADIHDPKLSNFDIFIEKYERILRNKITSGRFKINKKILEILFYKPGKLKINIEFFDVEDQAKVISYLVENEEETVHSLLKKHIDNDAEIQYIRIPKSSEEFDLFEKILNKDNSAVNALIIESILNLSKISKSLLNDAEATEQNNENPRIFSDLNKLTNPTVLSKIIDSKLYKENDDNTSYLIESLKEGLFVDEIVNLAISENFETFSRNTTDLTELKNLFSKVFEYCSEQKLESGEIYSRFSEAINNMSSQLKESLKHLFLLEEIQPETYEVMISNELVREDANLIKFIIQNGEVNYYNYYFKGIVDHLIKHPADLDIIIKSNIVNDSLLIRLLKHSDLFTIRTYKTLEVHRGYLKIGNNVSSKEFVEREISDEQSVILSHLINSKLVSTTSVKKSPTRLKITFNWSENIE